MRGDYIVYAENLHKYFRVGGLLSPKVVVRAVDGVTIGVRRGEALAVVGESGSGKTTLGRTILRLYTPDAGRVVFDGVDITRMPEKKLRRLRRRMQLIPQDPYAAFNPQQTIGDSVREVLEVHGIARGAEAVERVYKLFERVGLTPPDDFYHRKPYQLSGGQLQRAAIARAMILEPDFIVADEPTSNLDVSIRAGIIDLILEFREKLNQALLFITHDIATAKLVAQRVAVMYLGKIVEEGPMDKVTRSPLHPYTQALIEAIPRLHGKPGKPKIRGEIADPRRVPKGCRLHPRCPYAMDKCRREEPPLVEVEASRRVACWLHYRR